MDNQPTAEAAENHVRGWSGNPAGILRTQSAGRGNPESLRAVGAVAGLALSSLDVTPAARMSAAPSAVKPQLPRP